MKINLHAAAFILLTAGFPCPIFLITRREQHGSPVEAPDQGPKDGEEERTIAGLIKAGLFGRYPMADAAHKNTTRKFPGYSLANLEATVASYHAGDSTLHRVMNDANIAEIENEIANRKAGISIHFKVPQIA